MLKKLFKKVVEKQIPSRVLVSVLMVVVVTTFLLPARVQVDAQQIPQEIDPINLRIGPGEIDPNDPYGSLPPENYDFFAGPSSGQGLPLDLPPVPVGGVGTYTNNGANPPKPPDVECGSPFTGLMPYSIANCAVKYASNALLSTMSLIVWACGLLLNGAMYLTVHMKDVLAGIPVVDAGWVIFRDVANMLFIFVLLYIAIATILNVADTKKMLTTVIVTALLVNFSLFLTKVVVDASNVVALAFYNKILSVSTYDPTPQDVVLEAARAGPAWKLYTALRIQTVYDYGTGAAGATPSAGTSVNPYIAPAAIGAAQTLVGLTGANPFLVMTGFGKLLSATGGVLAVSMVEPLRMLGVALLGAIVMLVYSFVVVVGAVLLISRIIILMFLMMISPLAFVARVLPMTKGSFDKWFHLLINNAIFAPAYLALLYIVLETATNGLPGMAGGFSSAFSGAAGAFGVVLNYVFMIILIGATIFVAKSLGIYGADTAQKIASSASGAARGFVGKHTIGRAARRFEEYAENRPGWNKRVGTKLREWTTQPLSGAKFGGKESALELKKREKARVTAVEESGLFQELMGEVNKGDKADKGKLEDLALKISPHTFAHMDMRYLRKLPIESLPEKHWQAIQSSDKLVQSELDELTFRRSKGLEVIAEKGDEEDKAFVMLQDKKNKALTEAYFKVQGVDVMAKYDKWEKAKTEEEKKEYELDADETMVYNALKEAGVKWSADQQKRWKPAFEDARGKSVKELGQINHVRPELINKVMRVLNWAQIRPMRQDENFTLQQRQGQAGNQMREHKETMLLDAIDVALGIPLYEMEVDGKTPKKDKDKHLIYRSIEDRFKDRLERQKVHGLVGRYGIASIEDPNSKFKDKYTEKQRKLWTEMKAVSDADQAFALTLLEQHHEGRSDPELTMPRTFIRNNELNISSMGAGVIGPSIEKDRDKKEPMAAHLLQAIAEDRLTEANKDMAAKALFDRDADKFWDKWVDVAEQIGVADNEAVKQVLAWKAEGADGQKKFRKHLKTIPLKERLPGKTRTAGTEWDKIIKEEGEGGGDDDETGNTEKDIKPKDKGPGGGKPKERPTKKGPKNRPTPSAGAGSSTNVPYTGVGGGPQPRFGGGPGMNPFSQPSAGPNHPSERGINDKDVAAQVLRAQPLTSDEWDDETVDIFKSILAVQQKKASDAQKEQVHEILQQVYNFNYEAFRKEWVEPAMEWATSQSKVATPPPIPQSARATPPSAVPPRIGASGRPMAAPGAVPPMMSQQAGPGAVPPPPVIPQSTAQREESTTSEEEHSYEPGPTRDVGFESELSDIRNKVNDLTAAIKEGQEKMGQDIGAHMQESNAIQQQIKDHNAELGATIKKLGETLEKTGDANFGSLRQLEESLNRERREFALERPVERGVPQEEHDEALRTFDDALRMIAEKMGRPGTETKKKRVSDIIK